MTFPSIYKPTAVRVFLVFSTYFLGVMLAGELCGLLSLFGGAKCPLYSSVFRTESGRKWHIVHRHEIPSAFDIINKDYEVKTVSLQEESMRIKQEKGELEK